jgi:hypothetical protein
VEEQAGSSQPTSQHDACDDILMRFARLQLILTDLLCAVDDDARRMDASLEDAHRLVEEVRSCAKNSALPSHSPRNFPAWQRDHKAFEKARVAENDTYEVYYDALERYQRRRMKDLSVAEPASDRLVLVRRRRDYIWKLLAFRAKASVILGELRERSSGIAK